MASDYTRLYECRLCNSTRLRTVLPLPPTPAANEFLTEHDPQQDVFPLDLVLCEACFHHQLSVTVDPVRLFQNYVYVSGTSAVFRKHFERYVEDLDVAWSRISGPSNNRFVVEIGSNDGTMLKFFKAKGYRVLGVDPAIDIARKASEEGIPTDPTFFTEDVAIKIKARQGLAKFIVANNVFAHSDAYETILRGVKALLAFDGVFAFEVSYFVDVCKKTLFDTIYHEHVSYHTLLALMPMLEEHGFRVLTARRSDSHGGSLRVECTHASSPLRTDHHGVQALLAEEYREGFDSRKPAERLAKNIQDAKTALLNAVISAKASGQRVAAFGAPAKATTLMYAFGLTAADIDFVVDDSPLKQGRFTPGLGIPVLPRTALYEKMPGVCVILAWNFAPSIIEANQEYLQRGGKFIVPLPSFQEHVNV